MNPSNPIKQPDVHTEGSSANIVDQNIAKLRQLFPDAFTESSQASGTRFKVDLGILRQLLGEYVEEEPERYSFAWHGKSRARRISQTSSSGTLRPDPKHSLDWSTTQNLYIEGDNLEVLKLLQKSYHRRVDMVYIDPPYNTGGDFIYPDQYTDNLTTYLRYTGQQDDNGLKISPNAETSGRYHTNWLNMMMPRLRLARNLLAEGGVLVSHIDEHEAAALELLLNEVFGEDNKLGVIVWDKKNPKGDARGVAVQHESILVYARDATAFKDSRSLTRPKDNAVRMLRKAEQVLGLVGTKMVPPDLQDTVDKYNLSLDLSKYEVVRTAEMAQDEYQEWLKRQDVSGGEAAYRLLDEHGQVYRTVSMAWPNKKKAPDEYFVPLIHPKTGRPCPVPERGWRNPPATMKQLADAGLIVFGADHTKQPERKYLLKENMTENIPSVIRFGGSDDEVLKSLGIPFENPKPLAVAKMLIDAVLGTKEGVVLDFFGGSGTAGHAVMQLNAGDQGKRRFILVQLPEPCEEGSEAAKAGFKTISELGRERLRRAAKQLRTDGEGASIDAGFRAFALDSSNIKPWDADFDTLEQAVYDSVNNIKPNRSESDVLYELLLKTGLDLSVAIEEHSIDGRAVSVIGGGALVVCLAESISIGVAEGIARLKSTMQPEVMRVVFRDSGFRNDVVKTNVVQILKQAGLSEEHVRSI